MAIHTIGDSHSTPQHGGWSGVINHHLGAKLCYSFGRDVLELCDIRQYGMQDDDTIIFSLGEIDCRCHVHKHINETTTYQQIIDNIVVKYFEAIKINIALSGITFKHICVYNIIPPANKHNSRENPKQPFLGSNEERKNYVLYFNAKLKELCKINNYMFFDIYDKYTDTNGFLSKDLSDGHVHIKDGRYILEFVKDNLL